ncbi:MAG: hypothetical protein ABDH18_03050 [Aquificaceae bacterium]
MPQDSNLMSMIWGKALEILEQMPNGIALKDLISALSEQFPNVNVSTIRTYVYLLKNENPEVLNPDRGFYILRKYLHSQTSEPTQVTATERSLYEPFANYLKEELQECTKFLILGNNQFGDKWGTPDVIGVYKLSSIALLQPQPEIISAEIKTDALQLITAFGQACAYKLFSHKVYLVVPRDSKEESRLESLCYRFGIGLVVFDPTNFTSPDFSLKMRAMKGEPDYFYLNEYLTKLTNSQLRTLFD